MATTQRRSECNSREEKLFDSIASVSILIAKVGFTLTFGKGPNNLHFKMLEVIRDWLKSRRNLTVRSPLLDDLQPIWLHLV